MLTPLISLVSFLYILLLTRQASVSINTYFQTACNSAFTYTLSPINDYYVSNANFSICSNITIASSVSNVQIAVKIISSSFEITNGNNFSFVGCEISFNNTNIYSLLSIFSLGVGSSLKIQVYILIYKTLKYYIFLYVNFRAAH